MNIHYTHSKEGILIPQLEKEGKIYRLHSLYNPYDEGEKMGIQDTKGSFLFALGVGFGYHLEAYQQSTLLLLQDRESSALLNCKENPHCNQNPLFDITLEADFQKVKAILHEAREKNPSMKIQWLILPGYQKALERYCEAVYQKMMDLLREWAKEEAIIHALSCSWKNHFRRNRQQWLIYPEKYHFQELDFNQKVVMIVAAAPSLDFHFETIEAKKKKGALLFSTDTALPALLAKKLVPDYTLTIDTQHHSLMHYLPPLGEIEEDSIKLIKDAFATPILDSLFTEVYPVFPPQKELVNFSLRHQLPLAFYETGGNVTHAAVSIALSARAKTILLFSADFTNFYHDPQTGEKIDQTHCKNSGYFFQIWATQNRFNNSDHQMVMRCYEHTHQNLLNDYKKRLFQRYPIVSKENYLQIESKPLIDWKKNPALSSEQIIQKLQECELSF